MDNLLLGGWGEAQFTTSAHAFVLQFVSGVLNPFLTSRCLSGDHEPGEDVESAGHQEAVLPRGSLAV